MQEFNNLTNNIKHLAQEYRATQEHYITLVLFGGKRIRLVYDNVPIDEISPLTIWKYAPYGMTPLYDAIGFTLCHTEIYVEKIADAVVWVSVITDGIDNSSEEYTLERLHGFICDLRGKGWFFTLMTANNNDLQNLTSIGFSEAQYFSCDEIGVKKAFDFLHQYYLDLIESYIK